MATRAKRLRARSECPRGQAGRALADALAEVREAADFRRCWALRARRTFVVRELLGPVGEVNRLHPDRSGGAAHLARDWGHRS